MRQRRVEEEERLFREQMQQAQLALQQQAQASLEKQRAEDLAYRARQEDIAQLERVQQGEDRAINQAAAVKGLLGIENVNQEISDEMASVLLKSPVHMGLVRPRLIDARPIPTTPPLDTAPTGPLYLGDAGEQAGARKVIALNRIMEDLKGATNEDKRLAIMADAAAAGVAQQVPAPLYGMRQKEILQQKLDEERRQRQMLLEAQIGAENRENKEWRARKEFEAKLDNSDPLYHPLLLEYSQNTVRQIDDLIGRPDDLTTPGDDSKPSRISNATAGVGGKFMRAIPFLNTEAKNVAAELRSTGYQVALSSLQRMRASSKTGGAVGNVALGELHMMENAIASIDTDQSPENLTRQLGILRESEQRFQDAVRRDMVRRTPGLNAGITVGKGPPVPVGTPGAVPPSQGGQPRRIYYDAYGRVIQR
jgi:hypothetical protein